MFPAPRPVPGRSGSQAEPGSGTDVVSDEGGGLLLVDPASVPDEPPPEIFYRHRVPLFPAIRDMFKRKGIIFALAERDVRASYKQATLGMGWALINPIIQVVLFTLIFGHVKSLDPLKGVPYPIFAYSGVICWTYFAGSFGAGSSAVIGNLNLLQKTHFPRECFPLSQILEQTLYTTIGLIPLIILFAVKGFAPHIQILWAPVFMAIEILFTAGMVLGAAALVVYVRDLTQITALIIQIGLFASPVIWPLSKLQKISFLGFHKVDLRPYYSFLNPLGPVIDSVRRTMLVGESPDWRLLAIAAVSASLYFLAGYKIFKRLEVGFADIS
jgi:ABC-2 type transport system permease protein/lipopolysaccharide transport system permease protein